MSSGDTLYKATARDARSCAGAWFMVEFTSGGTTEIAAGDTITGDESGATADVLAVKVRSGTWAGGDAAGYWLVGNIVGTFTSGEDVNTVGGEIQVLPFGNSLVSSLVARRPTLSFYDFDGQFAVLDGVMGAEYGSGNGTLELWFSMSDANSSDDVELDVYALGISEGDTTASAFAARDTVTHTVPNTAGEYDVVTLTIAAADMPNAREPIRLLLVRDTISTSDTAAGFWRFDSLVLREA